MVTSSTSRRPEHSVAPGRVTELLHEIRHHPGAVLSARTNDDAIGFYRALGFSAASASLDPAGSTAHSPTAYWSARVEETSSAPQEPLGGARSAARCAVSAVPLTSQSRKPSNGSGRTRKGTVAAAPGRSAARERECTCEIKRNGGSRDFSRACQSEDGTSQVPARGRDFTMSRAARGGVSCRWRRQATRR